MHNINFNKFETSLENPTQVGENTAFFNEK